MVRTRCCGRGWRGSTYWTPNQGVLSVTEIFQQRHVPVCGRIGVSPARFPAPNHGRERQRDAFTRCPSSTAGPQLVLPLAPKENKPDGSEHGTNDHFKKVSGMAVPDFVEERQAHQEKKDRCKTFSAAAIAFPTISDYELLGVSWDYERLPVPTLAP